MYDDNIWVATQLKHAGQSFSICNCKQSVNNPAGPAGGAYAART